YLHGYYDQMVEFLRNVFSAALKTNDALEKGVLTGCLRIAKESIFTGLNNFNVYSVFDKQSSSDFGFTPEEVMCLLNDYELRKFERTVKEW
ncbi:AAA family ATPase, partial [[Clostridium] innocuum]|nr:AAA family ATPase [[Clostridium] innocuum]